ncbi:MAG: hypothetical protein GY898_06085, partial [Proteobacteria bacterium]|nr:hypothetical protein [Pseudomonadota bacterium]
MALKPVESRDLSTFLRTGEFTEGNYFYAVSISAAPPLRAIAYYDRLDSIYFQAKINKDPGSHTEVHCAIDPLGLDNTSPASRYGYVSSGLRGGEFCVGEWDRVLNTQKLYTGTNPPNNFWTMDPVSFLIDNSMSLFGFNWTGGGGGTGVIGGWTNGQRSNFVIFESLGYAIAGCIQARHTDNVVYIGM